jgi:ribosomal protein L29
MANNKLAKAERQELSALDAAGLNAALDETQKKQWTDRFALGKRQLNDTAELRNARKRIARIKTFQNQLMQQEAKG